MATPQAIEVNQHDSYHLSVPVCGLRVWTARTRECTTTLILTPCCCCRRSNSKQRSLVLGRSPPLRHHLVRATWLASISTLRYTGVTAARHTSQQGKDRTPLTLSPLTPEVQTTSTRSSQPTTKKILRNTAVRTTPARQVIYEYLNPIISSRSKMGRARNTITCSTTMPTYLWLEYLRFQGKNAVYPLVTMQEPKATALPFPVDYSYMTGASI